MALHIDPEQNEVRELKRLIDWHDKRVLEIGCGEGRLTRRLAPLGAIVHAIDPDAQLVRKAREALPKSLKTRVSFKTGKAEKLAHRDASFDVAVFAWSL